MKRVTDKVVEDLLEDLPEVGYVTKKQQQIYSSKLIQLEIPVHKNLWKAELNRLDDINKIHELDSIQMYDNNVESTVKRPKKRKLKSVVTKVLYEKPHVDSIGEKTLLISIEKLNDMHNMVVDTTKTIDDGSPLQNNNPTTFIDFNWDHPDLPLNQIDCLDLDFIDDIN